MLYSSFFLLATDVFQQSLFFNFYLIFTHSYYVDSAAKQEGAKVEPGADDQAAASIDSAPALRKPRSLKRFYYYYYYYFFSFIYLFIFFS